MHILFAGINFAPELTGIAPYTTSLAQGLADRGHKVHVLTGIPHYPEWRIPSAYTGRRDLDEELGDLSIRRLRHHVPALPNARGRVRMEVSFGRRLLTASWGEPDVLICVSPALISTATAVLRARIRPRRPAVGIWLQDLYARGVVETEALTGAAAAMTKRLESATLRSADGVVAIHDRFKDFLVSDLKVSERSVTVIRNWTHIDATVRPDRKTARRRFGWRNDEVIVLHAGNMGAKQGLENVVDAARLATRSAPHVRFVLLGDGNQRARLEELGRNIDNLEFLRPLPEPDYRAALTAADVLLVNEKPGVREMAVPSKLTSYFAAGSPVLAATDTGSITAEEVRTAAGGLIVAAGSPGALVQGVLTLGSDPTAARRLGASGRRFSNTVLSRHYAIDHFENWIQDVVDAREA